MSKKLIGLTLALALFAVALPVSASNLTQPQIQAIIGILQSFGAEQSVINSVYVSLGGGTSSNTGSGSSCIELSYNLFSGSTDGTSGGQVTRLQRFLGVSQTGYFGPETEAAVQRWQSSHSIVSSGSPDSTGYGYVGAKTRAAMRCGVDHEPYQPPVNTDWPSLSFSPFIKAGAQGDTWAEGLNIEGLAVVIKNDTQQRQQITFPTNCWYTYRIYDRVTKKVVFDLGSQQKCMAPGSAPGTTFVLAPGESKNIDVVHRNSDFRLRPGSYDMRVDINSKQVLKEAVQFLFNVAGDNNSSPSATVDAPVIKPISGSDRFDVAFKGSAVNFGGTHAGDQRYNWAWVSVVPSSYDGSLDLHAFKGKGESGPIVGSSGAEVHNNEWSHSFNLAAGTYKVLVYDYYGVSSMPVTTRTITISNNKTATLDQNSLIVHTEKDYTRVTVTGSASNVERVDIGVKGYSDSSARVVNGRWSATLGESLPTGTYALQVTDAFSNVVLTTGTLVVKTNMQTRDVQINSFTVSPSSVRAGEVVTFAWSSNLTQNDVSQHGGGCSIEGITKGNVALNVTWGFIEPNGQIGHIPQETAVYTLHCSSSAKDGSAVDTKQITVNVY